MKSHITTAFGLLFAAGLASADITVSSDPVGYYRIPLTEGFQTVGVSLVNSPEFVTLVTSSGTTSATSTESTVDVGALLDPAEKYYVEVVDGPTSVSDAHVGHRFEVDVAATISTAPDGDILFDPSANTNTTFPVPDLSDYRIELRKHLTLGEAFDKDQLFGSLQLSSADQVQFFDGTSFKPYYLLAQSNEPGALKIWGEFDFTNADSVVIPPGVGVVFKRSSQAPGSADVIVTGKVRTNPFYQILDPGFNFVAEPFPVSASFTDRQAFPTDFTPNFAASQADQVQVLEGGSFTTYYLAGTAAANAWVLVNDLGTNQNDTQVFDYRHPVFFKMVNPATSYRVPLLWTP